MARILFASDVHIGIRYPYLVNLRTGISQRTMDFIDALARVVDYAIQEQIDIFVICGDLYDRVTIGPTLLRQVREKIWQPLIENRIPIVLVGGNHDSPQILEKGSPFGEISIIPNSYAVRYPQSQKVKARNTGEEIGFVLLPYMTATQAVAYAEEQIEEEIERGQHLLRSQQLFRDWINHEVNQLDTKVKFIVGHFFVEGSRIGILPYPDQLPHEFKFKRDMLPLEDIDLAVFGHVHTNQVLLNGKLLVPGSLERVDFGETTEDKGFYVYDTETKKLEFLSNNPRALVRKFIEVPSETQNPTEFILERLPKKIEGAIVRLEIHITPSLQKQVIVPRIYQTLEKVTFHYDINWTTSETIKEIVLSELILDPLVLFTEFVSEQYSDYPFQKELRDKGLEILNTAISRVEESK
ncbi:MAG: exonuclease subunit SbcD [Candidatus Heimdallarchaeota archaeon]|nr:MAG: exonuclease subunit SbcD [Candidatus Heimdallarchaeota archaeon]